MIKVILIKLSIIPSWKLSKAVFFLSISCKSINQFAICSQFQRIVSYSLYFTCISYQSRLFCLVDALNSICTFPLYITGYFMSNTTCGLSISNYVRWHRMSYYITQPLLVAKCESLQSAKIQLSPCIHAISQLSPLQSASLRDNIT